MPSRVLRRLRLQLQSQLLHRDQIFGLSFSRRPHNVISQRAHDVEIAAWIFVMQIVVTSQKLIRPEAGQPSFRRHMHFFVNKIPAKVMQNDHRQQDRAARSGNHHQSQPDRRKDDQIEQNLQVQIEELAVFVGFMIEDFVVFAVMQNCMRFIDPHMLRHQATGQFLAVHEKLMDEMLPKGDHDIRTADPENDFNKRHWLPQKSHQQKK